MEVALSNAAIIIGNANYNAPLSKLDCCKDDAHAIKELLDATGKYSSVELLLDLDAALLKDHLRTFASSHKGADEIFFYFSGHGLHTEADFFYCPIDFDSKRPNETGLSNTELHVLLRSMDAELIVKVIDACNSGSLLIKSEGSFAQISKDGLRKFLQFASCLDSQNSLTGDPLSEFTTNFRDAALRRTEGIVFYSDILEVLRDKYLDNNAQTPHFITQGTGREQFVDDATRLAELRKMIRTAAQSNAVSATSAPVASSMPDIVSLLNQTEQKFATPAIAKQFVNEFFRKIIEEVDKDWRHRNLFTVDVAEHSTFKE